MDGSQDGTFLRSWIEDLILERQSLLGRIDAMAEELAQANFYARQKSDAGSGRVIIERSLLSRMLWSLGLDEDTEPDKIDMPSPAAPPFRYQCPGGLFLNSCSEARYAWQLEATTAAYLLRRCAEAAQPGSPLFQECVELAERLKPDWIKVSADSLAAAGSPASIPTPVPESGAAAGMRAAIDEMVAQAAGGGGVR